MFITAGSPGSGKSTLLHLSSFNVDWFNADDEAAKRNGGSYKDIPQTIRNEVNSDFGTFIQDHIRSRSSFAVETTLRSDIAIRQAKVAKDSGFKTEMFYIATEDISINLRRVIARAAGGGHSAPEETLRSIYAASYRTLVVAIASVGVALNQLTVFDNSVATVYMTPSFQLAETADRKLELRGDVLPGYLRPYYQIALARL